ncbi:Nitrate/nitrite sensor protein [Klebsiella aerogenes]|nr:Nitrate/nitrite sensor protein [Klebsiella aerogenes]
MLKRLFTPLTLVNQLALIVLLATIIGVAGMAISARLVHGVQGSAHAINKAGSLRMQSYRLLAAIPLTANDQKLFNDMTATVFSPELQYSARRDGQEVPAAILAVVAGTGHETGRQAKRRGTGCRRLCRPY